MNFTIYMLLNTTNDMKYIGCSVCSGHRRVVHFGALKRNQHKTKEMQSDYNKGHKFEYHILESIDDHFKSLILEKAYIKYFKNVYNKHKNTIFSKLHPEVKINVPEKFKNNSK